MLNQEPLLAGCAKTSRSHSEKSKNKPFIVDLDSRLLKRNSKLKLSRGARSLYGTLRALANGRTGALTIRGNPLDWQFICRQAEVSHCTWRKYRTELLDAGLLWEQRERVTIFKDCRKRVVLGRTTYHVRRQAVAQKTAKNPAFLLSANSSSIEELAPQDVQKHHKPYAGAGVCSEAFVLEPALEPDNPQSSSPSPTPKTDDDAVRVSSLQPETQPDNLAILRAQAEKKLQDRSAPELLEIILDFVLQRLVDRAVPISSSAYIVKCVENLLQNPAEYNPLFDEWQNRARRRGDFMHDFDATQYSDEPDAELTAKLREAVANSKGDA
jgi:hypothetical protein